MNPANKPPEILLITAMAIETQAVVRQLGPAPITHPLARTHSVLEWRGPTVTLRLLESGIGLASAAVALALFLEKFRCDLALALGVAGALAPELEIGDWVAASTVVQHDSVCSFPDELALMAPGEPFLSVAPETRASPVFSLAKHPLTEAALGLVSAQQAGGLREGLLLSGSEFVGSHARKAALRARFPQALAVEMESAGVCVVAKRYGIPLQVWKTIADRNSSGDSAPSGQYQNFLALAADRAAIVASHLYRGEER